MTTFNAANLPELTLNGQLIIGSTSANSVAATLTAGTNISVTNGAGSISIAAINSLGPTNDVAASPQTLAVNNRYVTDNGGTLVTYLLPATAALGDTIEVLGKSSGLFKITQNASQQINAILQSTTAGTGGSLQAVEQYNWIRISCITAGTSTIWLVTGITGDFTII